MTPVISPDFPGRMAVLAAITAAHGEALVATGRHSEAATWFRASEAADDLFLALADVVA